MLCNCWQNKSNLRLKEEIKMQTGKLVAIFVLEIYLPMQILFDSCTAQGKTPTLKEVIKVTKASTEKLGNSKMKVAYATLTQPHFTYMIQYSLCTFPWGLQPHFLHWAAFQYFMFSSFLNLWQHILFTTPYINCYADKAIHFIVGFSIELIPVVSECVINYQTHFHKKMVKGIVIPTLEMGARGTER